MLKFHPGIKHNFSTKSLAKNFFPEAASIFHLPPNKTPKFGVLSFKKFQVQRGMATPEKKKKRENEKKRKGLSNQRE